MLRTFALAIALLIVTATGAVAQNGHFITNGRNAPTCSDTGLTVACSGKVAGLGGTTFEITATAQGTATVECTNPGGNVAPGQTFDFESTATTGLLPTPKNGQYTFLIVTSTPSAPADSCPNPQWSAAVVDVEFTTATLSLFENGELADQVTVTVG